MKNKLSIPFYEGPIFAAEKRLEDFSYNLYFSYIFGKNVEQHQQLQDEYIDAFLAQDEDKMQRLNLEIALIEGAFEVTANMLEATEGTYS